MQDASSYRPSNFERGAFWSSLLIAVVAFFAPLFLIWYYQDAFGTQDGPSGGEATVGVAVILRATARRLMRSGSSSIMRTTLSAYTRASGRAVTRRAVKFGMRVLFGSVSRQVVDETVKEAGGETSQETEPDTTVGWFSLPVGALALLLSFWGILCVIPEEKAAELTTDKGLGFWTAAGFATIPLVVYALMNLVGGRLFGVHVRMTSALDGLLLQAYFTGAGSFLPMTTDFEYEGGSDGANAKVAAFSLGVLYLIHLGLNAFGGGSYQVEFLSTMFLIYCFVYSFPIKPLEGYDILKFNKLLWFVFWVPILWSFGVSLPNTFAGIL